jgi:hypothetical protein
MSGLRESSKVTLRCTPSVLAGASFSPAGGMSGGGRLPATAFGLCPALRSSG